VVSRYAMSGTGKRSLNSGGRLDVRKRHGVILPPWKIPSENGIFRNPRGPTRLCALKADASDRSISDLVKTP